MEPTTFAELGLSAKVLAAVTAAGYTQPTPIQIKAIPVAVTGRDVLGIAQTGTGKTAAFVMPMITRLETGRARARMPRSLILAPTRELAAQVEQSFEKYGVNHKLDVALLIGGVSMDDQVRKLDRGVDVLIATPGRLLDHFGRGKVMLMGVEILVIDEADRMLDMGFIPDIEKICKLLPPRRQTLFFSATMPPEITRLVDQFLKDPVRVEADRPATAAATITQLFQYCPDGEDFVKRELLRDLIRSQQVKNAIIFCNRKRDVAILLKSLLKHGFNAGALHGDMDQMSRTATLDKFRSGEIALLAASDVAARGLDIPDVSHIFNFDVPWQADDYVHRIGRTGRAGKEGTSATIVTPDDMKALGEIEKIMGVSATWLGTAPTEDEIADGSKRKRGRGRGKSIREARSSGRREERAPRRETSAAPRREADGEPRHSRPPRERPRDEAPREATNATGHVATDVVPGLGDQPILAPVHGDQPARQDAGGERREPRAARSAHRLEQRREDHRDPREQRGSRAPRAPREDRKPREPRESREPREPRADREPREQRADREPREPRADREPREPRADREPREPREKREQPADRVASVDSHAPSDRQRDRPRRHHDSDSGPRVGFADNLPAFLKKPVKAGT